MSKVRTIAEAVQLIPDGALLALGGNAIQRSPAAFVRELARQKKKKLELIKTAGAYDVDLLCWSGAVSVVHAGYIGFETIGLAPHYRQAVEAGRVKAAEHACYSVVAGLRAAAYGVPFLPIGGFQQSDLPAARAFQWVDNPYGEGQVLTIPALKPDFAIIHVHEADEEGNGRIFGSVYEDVLMSRAAKKVILTTEKIVSSESFKEQPELTQIPGFLVDAVVEVAGGALPGTCQPFYDADYELLVDYVHNKEKVLEEYLREERYHD